MTRYIMSPTHFQGQGQLPLYIIPMTSTCIFKIQCIFKNCRKAVRWLICKCPQKQCLKGLFWLLVQLRDGILVKETKSLGGALLKTPAPTLPFCLPTGHAPHCNVLPIHRPTATRSHHHRLESRLLLARSSLFPFQLLILRILSQWLKK